MRVRPGRGSVDLSGDDRKNGIQAGAASLPAVRDVAIDQHLSTKLRVVTLLAVCAVLVVHAYNLNSRFATAENGPEVAGAPGVVGFIEYLGSQALARWPAAILFAMSGFLFFRNLEPRAARFVAKILRRFRTLGVPFLLWSAWGLVVLFLLRPLVAGTALVTSEGTTPTVRLVLDRLLVRPVAYPLWFLQALLFCILVSPLLYALIRWLGLVALVPLATMWLLDVEITNYVNCKALTFFSLGATIAICRREGRRFGAPAWLHLSPALSPDRRRPWARVAGVWLPLLWLVCCLAYTALLRGESAFWAHGLHKGLMALGVASVWFGYDVWLAGLGRRRRVVALLPFAFFIFVAQEPTLMVFKRAFLRALGGGDAARLVTYFVAPTVTLMLVVAVARALRRHAPRAYALLSGWR